jgi:hypothetical protein
MRPTFGLPPMWPGRPAIDQLTECAAGLFIWAEIAMTFMEERWGDPDAKLKLVLARNLGKQSESLDTLYRQSLELFFGDADVPTLALFRAVLGIIITAKVSLHREDLKHFLGPQLKKENWRFNAILYGLSSVMELGGSIRLRHLSFAEFLCDPERC